MLFYIVSNSWIHWTTSIVVILVPLQSRARPSCALRKLLLLNCQPVIKDWMSFFLSDFCHTKNGCLVQANCYQGSMSLDDGQNSTPLPCVVPRNVNHIATSWKVDSETDAWNFPCHAKWPKNCQNWAEMRISEQKMRICGRAINFFLYNICSVCTSNVW